MFFTHLSTNNSHNYDRVMLFVGTHAEEDTGGLWFGQDASGAGIATSVKEVSVRGHTSFGRTANNNFTVL